jgi:hypothetical protein
MANKYPYSIAFNQIRLLLLEEKRMNTVKGKPVRVSYGIAGQGPIQDRILYMRFDFGNNEIEFPDGTVIQTETSEEAQPEAPAPKKAMNQKPRLQETPAEAKLSTEDLEEAVNSLFVDNRPVPEVFLEKHNGTERKKIDLSRYVKQFQFGIAKGKNDAE